MYTIIVVVWVLFNLWCQFNFFFNISCQSLSYRTNLNKQILYLMYLQSNDFESTNSSLSMFDLQAVNSVECGSIWLSTKCCKELLYSKPSQRCIGVHFLDFRSNSLNIPLFFPTYEGMLPFKKGVCFLWFLFDCLWYWVK